MGKKVIRLTEADIENIVKKVIQEQNTTQTPDRKVLLEQLEDKIISFLEDNRKNEFLKNIKISIDLKDVVINDDSPDWVRYYGFNKKPIVTITDGDGKKLISTELNYYEQGVRGSRGQETYFPGSFIKSTNGDTIFTNSGLYIGSFIDEIIGEDKVLKDFYEREPGVKEQVDSLPIMYALVLNDGSNNSNIEVSVSSEGRWEKFVDGVKRIFAPKKLSNKVTQGNTTTMDEAFYSRAKSISRWFDVGDYKVWLGIAPMMMPLYELNITTAFKELEGETVTPEFASEKIKLDLVDVFKFDTIDMNDPSGYQEVLVKFQSDLNDGLTGLKGFKGFLENQNLVVNGFASRDNDPNEKVQGKFSGCRGYGDGTRGQYNLCLSEERAKKVAEDLQEIFNSLGINVTIKSKGHGETSKFGPAWSKEKPTKPKDTQPNRRITFNIPKYTETIRN